MSLILDHVSHVYGDDTALAVKALDIPAPVNPRWCSI